MPPVLRILLLLEVFVFCLRRLSPTTRLSYGGVVALSKHPLFFVGLLQARLQSRLGGRFVWLLQSPTLHPNWLEGAADVRVHCVLILAVSKYFLHLRKFFDLQGVQRLIDLGSVDRFACTQISLRLRNRQSLSVFIHLSAQLQHFVLLIWASLLLLSCSNSDGLILPEDGLLTGLSRYFGRDSCVRVRHLNYFAVFKDRLWRSFGQVVVCLSLNNRVQGM